VAAAVMREDDRRKSTRLGRGIANSRLAAWRIAWRNSEDVPSFCSKVLTFVLRRGGVPDLAREGAIPCRVDQLSGPHPNRKWATDERIVGSHVAILLPGSVARNARPAAQFR
jgi:hypothetical protein